MTPYDIGYEAREDGVFREPAKAYPNNPERATEWARGWDAADRDIKHSQPEQPDTNRHREMF